MSTIDRELFYPKVKVGDYWERDYLYKPISGFYYNQKNIRTYIVKQEDLVAPDKVSAKVYGNEYMWWIISAVNGIMDPLEQLYIGQLLIIPDINDIYNFFNEYRLNE